jgi:hypothetical protein
MSFRGSEFVAMPEDKKALYDYQPKELSNEGLNRLYAGLVAKLTLVIEERIQRFDAVISATVTLLETDDQGNLSEIEKDLHKQQAIQLTDSSKRMRALHRCLSDELVEIKAAREVFHAPPER